MTKIVNPETDEKLVRWYHEYLGVFVVAHLDMLHGSAQAEDPDDRGCCADCCAPCGIVRDMLNLGVLPDVVGWAPDHLAASWSGLDEDWLRAQWGCKSNPPCNEQGDKPCQG